MHITSIPTWCQNIITQNTVNQKPSVFRNVARKVGKSHIAGGIQCHVRYRWHTFKSHRSSNKTEAVRMALIIPQEEIACRRSAGCERNRPSPVTVPPDGHQSPLQIRNPMCVVHPEVWLGGEWRNSQEINNISPSVKGHLLQFVSPFSLGHGPRKRTRGGKPYW